MRFVDLTQFRMLIIGVTEWKRTLEKEEFLETHQSH